MPPQNTARIQFVIDNAVAKAQLVEFDNLMKGIVETVKRLGGALTPDQLKGLADNSTLTQLRALNSELLATERNARAAITQIRTLGQAPLGGSFNVGSRTGLVGDDLSARIARQLQQGGGAGAQSRAFANEAAAALSSAARFEQSTNIATRSLQARFNAAAQAVDGTKKKLDEATVSGKKLEGVSLLVTAAFTKLGIPGAEAISVLSRQFLEQGLTIKGLFESPTFRLGVSVAGAIAFGSALTHVLGTARQTAFELENIQRLSSFRTSVGQGGGSSQLEQDLRRLEQAKKDIEFFLGAGGTNTGRVSDILRETLGGGAGRDQITRLQSEIEFVQRQRQGLTGKLAGLIGFGPSSDDLKQLQLQLRQARGGIVAPEELIQRSREAAAEFNKIELFRRANGQDNVFDQARDSLRGLAFEANKVQELDDFIDKLTRSGLGPLEISQRVSEFRRELNALNDERRRAERLETQITEQFAKANQQLNLSAAARRELNRIEKSGATSPLSRLLEDAQLRNQNIRDQFGQLGQGRIAELIAASNSLLLNQAFSTNLVEVLGSRKLVQQINQLQSGIGLDARGIADRERDRVAEARVREARLSGDRDALRAAQAEFLDRETGLSEQARQARFRGEFVKAAELENQIEQLRREEREFRFQRDTRGSELTFLRDQLRGVNRPEDQALVLDRILELTSNVSQLNADEAAQRIRDLQQRLSLGERERQKVLIEINNNARDVATAREVLGPQPDPVNTSSAFDVQRGANSLTETRF